MRTTYIKTEHLNWYETPFYYKIIEKDKETTKLVTIHGVDIDINDYEDYNDTISFVCNTLCNGNWSIIDRKDFDIKYIEVVKNLNELAGC